MQYKIDCKKKLFIYFKMLKILLITFFTKLIYKLRRGKTN